MSRTGPLRWCLPAAVVSCAVGCAGGCSAAGRPVDSAEHSGSVASTARRDLATQYLVIARAGNQRLEIDFDALSGRDRGDLLASRTDLRDAAATERSFDRRLLQIPFPTPVEATGRRLYRVNQSRAQLTAEDASARSLADLHADQPTLTAFNGPVEQAVRVIRRQLGLPAPADN